MKKKNKKKKFLDFDIYNKDLLIKKENDNTFSKDDEDEKNEYNNSKKKEKKKNFNSALDELKFLFPNFSSDLVEEFYEENDKNFSRTKNILIELSEQERLENINKNINNNENLINENNNHNETDLIKEGNKVDDNYKESQDNNKKNYLDITSLAKFEFAGNDEYIEDIKDKKEENIVEKKELIKEQNENNNKDYNPSLDIKEKNKSKDDFYLFNGEANDNNNNCIKNYTQKEEITIDDYLFEQNIEFLCECFPQYKREEIIEKICDNKFDIDEAAASLLKEMNINVQQNEEDLANLEITDKEEILSNFLCFENGNQNEFDYELFQNNLVQKEIEEMIKKENYKKLNTINENNNTKNELISYNKVNDDEKEENFLNKKIEDINTPKIKEDLKKLVKHFPLEDEYAIKLVYYQFMNYQLTYKHFDDKNTIKIGLKTILNDKYNDFKVCQNSEGKKYNANKNNNQSDFSEKQFEIFKRIIDKKPINWKLEEEKNYDLKDYMAIRKKLIFEAKKAYSNRKYKNGQILMAKAKRYKQEIDKIYKNQKIKQFTQNNENRNSNEIDLHGLNVEESKYIIKRKINLFKEKKNEQELKSISFVIITGTGSHSVGRMPVLYPSLLDWLKNKEKLSAKGNISKGIIFVTIY